MTRTFLKTCILLLLMAGNSLYAIEQVDVFNTTVLEVFAEDKLQLDRGFEDDINQGDYAKFYANNKIVARGVAIQSTQNASIWVLYVKNLHKFTKNEQVTIKGLPPKKLTENETDLLKDIYSDTLREIERKRKDEEIRKAKELAMKKGVKEEKSVVEENLTRFFRDDLNRKTYDSIYFQARIAPLQFEKAYDAKSISYGAKLASNGSHEFALHYDYETTSRYDKTLNRQNSVSHYDAGFFYDINNISPQSTYFTMATYKRSRDGMIYSPRRHINVGVVGIKYMLIKDQERIKHLSFSYIPVIDYRSEEFMNYSDGAGEKKTVTNTNVRHAIRLKLVAESLDESIKVTNVTFLKPLHKIKDFSIQPSDSDFSNDFDIAHKLSKNFALSYHNTITWDTTRRDVGGQATNIIHSININYQLNIL